MTRLIMNTVIMLVTVFFSTYVQGQKVELLRKDEKRAVEVMVDGQLFTSYLYLDTAVMKKSILFPVHTSSGAIVTRGWPLEPRAHERIDHPHHVGVWFNYEEVNGIDFWNNSDKVNPKKKHYGTILHTGIRSIKSGQSKGTLEVTANWLDNTGKVVLEERTKLVFSAKGTQRIVDRITTLKAVKERVEMGDVKDGFFAIRVARELDHPSEKPDTRTDEKGEVMSFKTVNNQDVTGHFRNKEGVEGDDAWGKSSAWCNLTGTIGEEKVSVLLIDHPKNPGYPSHWHARGYGLFGINPLGRKAYDKTKEPTSLRLAPTEEVTFRFRLVIDSTHLTDAEINKIADQFASVK